MKRFNVYGWIPDRPDHRDYLYSAIAPKVRIPSRVDLRNECSPVENQGRLGSCTANALAGNLEFLEEVNGSPYKDLSRLFIYYNERAIEGTVNYDSGAMIRDGIKGLAKYGVCTELSWPYDISEFTRKPASACYKQALKRRIVSYHRLLTLDEMLNCLAEGFPFVFGFSVYESFESAKVASTGIVPMPGKKEKLLGGHAVLAVGYDQRQKRFIVRNSWGPQWGQEGYFTMPYKYLETLADDFWTIRQ
ncbi:MAG: C1 family peptidase [Candidatus Omnitrophica bacterium]|nr:C1 family peptidase [Candidatus Omnitrophota bacterium]MDE2223023.1 C1 family peptidase [Candidatus Omnitrophota bacterium]